MPPTQRGQAYRLAPNRWGLRFYGTDGERRRKSPFPTKSAALAQLPRRHRAAARGEPAAMPDITLAELVDLFLERHASAVRASTITTLTERLGHAARDFGDVPLRELRGMTSELAAWQARQPPGVRYGRMTGLRQVLAAGQRWGYIDRNPALLVGRNRQPPPRAVRVFTPTELDAIAAELHPAYRPLPAFAAATGLRPQEWQALERRDIDRRAGELTVHRTVSGGEIVELGKTTRSLRQVPLSARASAALDELPPRLDTALIWPAPSGGVIDLHNWRSRIWLPAIRGGRNRQPRADLRPALDVRVERAGRRRAGVHRREGRGDERADDRAYGARLDGAMADIAGRLNAFDSGREQAADDV